VHEGWWYEVSANTEWIEQARARKRCHHALASALAIVKTQSHWVPAALVSTVDTRGCNSVDVVQASQAFASWLPEGAA
jgi:hypothetical protein